MKGALAVITLTTGLLPIPTAHAYTSQEWNFIHHTAEIGITSGLGPSGMITVGWAICGALASGEFLESIVFYLFAQSNIHAGGITWTQAEVEVALAAVDLCPGVSST